MKVAYVIDRLEGGGTEKSTRDLANELARQGHDIVLCALVDSNTSQFLDPAIEIVSVSSQTFAPRVREVRRVLKDATPDIVHTSLYQADQVGRVAGRLERLPVVSSLVGTPYARERLQSAGLRPSRLKAAQAIDLISSHLFVDAFHAVSDGTAECNRRALLLPDHRIHVAARGRDPAELGERTLTRTSAVRSRLGIAGDEQIVLGVGRQDHAKGFRHLIEAMVPLSASRCVKVLLAGGAGNASAGIKRAVEMARCNGAEVEILGARSDVPDLIACADVLALPSLHEGFPGVVFEAMGLGTPVVASDIAGIRGILKHGENALLCAPGDSMALSKSLATVLDDPQTAARISSRARTEFDESFTLTKAVDRMLSLYETVLSRR
jgi:glycosyltransferase involved in cell wall biosynthesis